MSSKLLTPSAPPSRGESGTNKVLPFVSPHPVSHLSQDQMGDLLARSSSSGEQLAATAAAEAHLRSCPACAAEFESLREALSLFREASSALADRELGRLQTQARPRFPVLPVRAAYPQALFWLAASAILMAGIVPLEMRWQRTPATPVTTVAGTPASSAKASARTAESDEALMADVDRVLSASVPASMQPLSDPAEETAETASPALNQNSIQRKD